MSLNADTLLQIVNLKQQLSKWRVIAILVAVLSVFIFFAKFSDSKFSPIKHDYIARLTIDGVIDDNPKLSKLIKDARENDNIKAVVVWFDTPGGGAVGGQQLYLDLLKLAEKKPVVSVMRTTAASAGYMAALGADQIFAREGTITGSIGVVMQTFEATQLAEKLGVKPITVKSGINKASPNPFEKYTAENDVVIKAVVKDFYDWFVGIVAERRKLPREVVEVLADGRIYTGRQALKEKLIDALGGEEEAVDWLEKNKNIKINLDIKDIKLVNDSETIFSHINSIANGKLGTDLLKKLDIFRLDGLQAIWQAN
jgi:protease IV